MTTSLATRPESGIIRTIEPETYGVSDGKFYKYGRTFAEKVCTESNELHFQELHRLSMQGDYLRLDFQEGRLTSDFRVKANGYEGLYQWTPHTLLAGLDAAIDNQDTPLKYNSGYIKVELGNKYKINFLNLYLFCEVEGGYIKVTNPDFWGVRDVHQNQAAFARIQKALEPGTRASHPINITSDEEDMPMNWETDPVEIYT